MNNRFWMIIAGAIGVAIFAFGWFLGVAPKVDELNASIAQQASVEVQNKLHEASLADLKVEFEQIDALKSELASAQMLLPAGDDLSTFLGELHRLEASSGVVLTLFGASDGQGFIPAPASGATNPLVTEANFIAIPINLTVSGTREQVIQFVSDLQFGTRLFLVTALTVAQDPENPDVYDGNISGLVYVLVDPSSPPPTPTAPAAVETEAAAEGEPTT
ncbi:hypothetical protein QMG83_02730 [Salinibacterium sp. G-O1]|uniref:type 4a pilus biogenesis protein PilO n=1 Tax=Salinibacterium sp. G-O1 TaxID=3046208 RepID=UPI0024BBAE96|nr:hypothetical protein [Salinibacterium sp. G-O1]MDJ0334133.1 hypothetical protein [Salinibacterium sp. G-O1]